MHNFYCEELSLYVRFSHEAVSNLSEFKQSLYKHEAGGMLFCRDLHNETINITYASTPTSSDTRKKYFFKLDEIQAQKLISKKFKNGLHYVGDWHTHPQSHPKPSQQDIKTINDIFTKSQHELKYFLFIILSNSEFSNSYVAFANSNKVYQCRYILQN